MADIAIFQRALEGFLASDTFVNIVRDDTAEIPFVQRVVELHRDGTFTVYSKRHDAPASGANVILDIPSHGTMAEVANALRAELARALPPA